MADYQEAPGSPKESLGKESPVATRIVYCDWDDRYDVYDEIIGEEYPFHSSTILIARQIDIDPFDTKPMEAVASEPKKVAWDVAVLTIHYDVLQGGSRDPTNPGGPTYNPMKMTYFEESIDGTMEFLTIDNQKFWWHSNESDTSVLQTELVTGKEAAALQMFGFDWVLEYQDVQVLPNYSGLIGKVNDAEVVSQTLGYTFAPETLLFHPPSLRRTVTNTGTSGWNMRLALSFRQNTWNKFYWPNWQEFESAWSGESSKIESPWNYIVNDAVAGYVSPYKPYPPVDFTPILPPPADP